MALLSASRRSSSPYSRFSSSQSTPAVVQRCHLGCNPLHSEAPPPSESKTVTVVPLAGFALLVKVLVDLQ